MSARTLVVGLDGADLDVIAALGPSRMPHLHAAMARGAWSRLRSVLPPRIAAPLSEALREFDRRKMRGYVTQDAVMLGVAVFEPVEVGEGVPVEKAV